MRRTVSQLGVVQRSTKRPKLTAADRFLWTWLSQLWSLNLSEETTKGMTEKARAGIYASCCRGWCSRARLIRDRARGTDARES
jgi:hypothetical protein